MTFRLGMTVDLCRAYMLISMTLSLMHGDSDFAEEKKSALNYLDE